MNHHHHLEREGGEQRQERLNPPGRGSQAAAPNLMPRLKML